MSIHIRSGEGQHHAMIDGDHVAKLTVQDDVGAFEVFEIDAPARPMAPPHVSPWSGALYLLEGRVTAMVDGTKYDAEAGDIVHFPAGTPATFEVVGESARFLAITSGTGAGRFFEDFSQTVPADRPPQESMEQIMTVTSRHGVSMAGS